MSFYIQVSNPTFQIPDESYDDSLKEVIEAIFPYECELIFIVWNGLPVPIMYKYDLSLIINSILSLINLLLFHEDRNFSVNLACFTFSTSWHFNLSDGVLIITSAWRIEGENKKQEYEDRLNEYNRIEIKKSDFLAEWKMLLQKIIEAIEKSNLKVDKKSLRYLHKTEKAIPRFGRQYQEFPLNKNPDLSRIILTI
jgi:hypothetical protein